MEEKRTEVLNRLLNAYGRWYNIEHLENDGQPLVATGAFHEHGEGFLLIKKAKTWTADRHEYIYFFSVPNLDMNVYNQCLATTRELGEPLINPVRGHMSTYLVMVILCDTADADALKALKKSRITKSFQFSLKGWMEVHTAAVEVGMAKITANAFALNTAKFLKSVISPKEKTRSAIKNQKKN